MKILAINAGSSSLKYQIFEMPSETVICSGIAERIGYEDAIFSLKFNGKKYEETLSIKNHQEAAHLLLSWIEKYDVISDIQDITGVGHRVVHGGEYFNQSVVVDDDVIKKIEALSDFAPLHNPANLVGIEVFKETLPNAVAVVVFDTAFHQTMPETSYMYATPYAWYEKYRVRKYGFHGTSHEYVSKEAAKLIGKSYDTTKTIVCHLGNGASLCAVKNGVSVDTSMGFTPLAGVPMGTRSGDIDPAIIPYIAEKEGLNAQQVVDLLNKESGFKGVSGLGSDARDLEQAAEAGHVRAQLTLALYAKRIAETIGAYQVTVGGADIIAFTAGIGENAKIVRTAVCDHLASLGVELDEEKNDTFSDLRIISTKDSKIKVAIIPTNEELVIARDTFSFIKK